MAERQIPAVNQRPSGLIPTTSVTNELADAVNAMAPAMPHGHVGGPRHAAVLDLWMVWDEGPAAEDEFEDNRYWLRRVFLSNAGPDPDPTDAAQAAEITIPDGETGAGDWIAATNMAERQPAYGAAPDPPDPDPAEWPYPAGHGLVKGTIVGPVWAQFDDATPFAQRFVFNHPQLTCKVTVTAESTRPGVYLGYRRRAVIQKFDPSGSSRLNADTINDFGEVPDDDQEIYIQNAAEEGTDTHALMDPDGDISKTHLGHYNGVATDGKTVYLINGSTAGDCTT